MEEVVCCVLVHSEFGALVGILGTEVSRWGSEWRVWRAAMMVCFLI